MKQYISGDKLYLWGKPYTLKLSDAGDYNIHMTQDEIILGVGENDTYNKRIKALNRFYSSELYAMVSILIEPCVKRVGVELESWAVCNNLNSYWGICWPKKKHIELSLHLAKLPLEWLEAVIIHELVHIIISGHSDRFYDRCEKYFPNYRKIDAMIDSKADFYM